MILLLGWIVDCAWCLCVLVLGVWELISAPIESSSPLPPTHFFHTHTGINHRGCQPITISLPSYSLLLRHSACVAMVIVNAPPTPCLCLFQYEDEADCGLMMQAGCTRHHFPREEGLFLPLGTKNTTLPSIFMEPHLITGRLQKPLFPTQSMYLSFCIHPS